MVGLVAVFILLLGWFYALYFSKIENSSNIYPTWGFSCVFKQKPEVGFLCSEKLTKEPQIYQNRQFIWILQ